MPASNLANEKGIDPALTADSRSYIAKSWPGVFTVGFWIALAFLGFPACNDADDIPFVGTAVEYARTGNLANPQYRFHLAGKGLRTDRFYVYPPLHGFVLGVWFTAFGVSAASLLAFHAFLNILLGLASNVLLHHFGASRLAAAGWNVLYAVYVSESGFRPDALGYTLLLCGLMVLIHRRPAATFLSAFLLTLAPLCQPSTIFYTLVMGPAIFVLGIARSSETNRLLLRHGTAFLGGAAAAVMVFLSIIGWEVTGFVTDFSRSLSLNVYHNVFQEPLAALYYFRRELVRGRNPATVLPVFLSSIAVCLVAVFRRRLPAEVLGCILALMFSICFNIAGCAYPKYRVHFILFLSSGAAFCLLASCRMRGASRTLLISLFASVLLLERALAIVSLLNREPPNQEHLSRIRAAVTKYERDPYYLILFDSVAARYVFDYDLPAHSAGRACSVAKDARPLPHQVLIVPEYNVRPQGIYFLGKWFHHIAKYPYRFALFVGEREIEVK